MMSIDPYTQAHLTLSIEVNGFALAAPSVPGSLLRFVRPLAFYNEGQTHELSFSGTSLRVRVRNRNFLLCSRHQLTNAGRGPGDIVMIIDVEGGRRVAINPNEVSQAVLDPAVDPDYADVADILLAEYAPHSAERDLAPHFLQMDLLNVPDLRAVPAGSIDAIFTLGFPTSDTDYETSYDEDYSVTGVDIVSRWWKLYFRQDETNDWDKSGLVPLEPARREDPIPKDHDGMSGAPVFFIHGMKQRRPGLGFAGIILRANKLGRANMLEAEAIRRAFRMHFDGA
ncbi:hypothetical protein J2Y54_002193 [Sphingomonas sp. BE123]|uniref:hypothetical protein n=1 Tax=Sphingomonas sp. BE123 TaxID=2817842 RepID=UPI00285FB488|nr:hypothetical protein [Sphingomonas sp. BE123]MDR6852673.1 hypothetical protein [Sphingomonas sp. BE123]